MLPLLRPLLLSTLPSQLASILLPYLTAAAPSLFPAAPPGTPIYARNYRWAFTLIVGCYLGYSFFADDTSTPGDDYYALLGVGRNAEDDTLKKAFRSLSRIHHPDRAGTASESHFILLRRAYETLSDPSKRYAYDRFGPDIVDWKVRSVREYMHTGMMRSMGFYIVSGGFMLALQLVGRAKEAAYWRYLLLALLLTLELRLLLSPTPSRPGTILRSFVSPLDRPQFLQIQLLHRLFTTSSIALTQLVSVWNPAAPRIADGMRAFEAVRGMVQAIELEAVKSFQEGVIPLLGMSGHPEKCEQEILSGMEKDQCTTHHLSLLAPQFAPSLQYSSSLPLLCTWMGAHLPARIVLVDRSLSTHPEIQPLWQAALRRPSAIPIRNPIAASTYPSTSTAGPRAYRYPTPSPGPSSPLASLSQADLSVAARIPLPPSPPPSPVLLPRMDG